MLHLFDSCFIYFRNTYCVYNSTLERGFRIFSFLFVPVITVAHDMFLSQEVESCEVNPHQLSGIF